MRCADLRTLIIKGHGFGRRSAYEITRMPRLCCLLVEVVHFSHLDAVVDELKKVPLDELRIEVLWGRSRAHNLAEGEAQRILTRELPSLSTDYIMELVGEPLSPCA